MQGFAVFVAMLALAAAAPASEGPLVQLVVNVNSAQSASPGPAASPVVAEEAVASPVAVVEDAVNEVSDVVIPSPVIVNPIVNPEPVIVVEGPEPVIVVESPEPVAVVENPAPEPIQIAQPVFPGVIAPEIVTPELNPIDVIAVGAPEINPIDILHPVVLPAPVAGAVEGIIV